MVPLGVLVDDHRGSLLRDAGVPGQIALLSPVCVMRTYSRILRFRSDQSKLFGNNG